MHSLECGMRVIGGINLMQQCMDKVYLLGMSLEDITGKWAKGQGYA